MATEDLGNLQLGLAWGAFAPAMVVVIFRLYSRISVRFSAGWDDLTIFLSVACYLAACVAVTLQVDSGFGRHFYTLNEAQKADVMKYTTVAELCSFVSLFFLRLSVCIFLVRLMQHAFIWIERILFVVMAINFAATVVIVVVYSSQCRPFEGIWNKAIHPKCYSQDLLTLTLRLFSGISIGVDLLCAFVPIPVLRKMKMDRRTKLQSCVLLGLGFLPAGCAVGKLVTGNKPTDDPSWVWVSTESFASWESGIGIVVASVPPLRQLVRLWYSNLTFRPPNVDKVDDFKPTEHESQVAINKSPFRSTGSSNADEKKKSSRSSLLRLGMPGAPSTFKSDGDLTWCDLESQKRSISAEKSMEPMGEVKDKPKSIGARFAAKIDPNTGTGTLCDLNDLSRASKDRDDNASQQISAVLSECEPRTTKDGEEQIQNDVQQQTHSDEDERWGISGEYNKRYGETLPMRFGSNGEYNQRFGDTSPVRFNSFGSNGEYNEAYRERFPVQQRGSSQRPQPAPSSSRDSQSLQKPELFSFYSSSEAGWMQMRSMHGDSARNSYLNAAPAGQETIPPVPQHPANNNPEITIIESQTPNQATSETPEDDERSTDERCSAFLSDLTPMTEDGAYALAL